MIGSMLPQAIGLLKHMLNSFHVIDIERENSAYMIIWKCL